MNKIFKRCSKGAIYICDTIRDKYNSSFNLEGETVYLSSSVQRKPFSPINTEIPTITYFGNISLGRNLSLDSIGHALAEINSNYKLLVYSSENHKEICQPLIDNENICYLNAIPYEEVKKKLAESDITVVVEGFREVDIIATRYSLTTKIADCLASGTTILAYGPKDCGAIDYLLKTDASFICTTKEGITNTIREMLNSTNVQEEKYYKQIDAYTKNHTAQRSCAISLKMINKGVDSWASKY